MAILILPDGSFRTVAFDNRADLAQLLDTHGIDFLWNQPVKGQAVAVSDTHLQNGSPLNKQASELAGEKVHGNAALLNPSEVRAWRKGMSGRSTGAFEGTRYDRTFARLRNGSK